jgi:Cu2+-exporting ATPase
VKAGHTRTCSHCNLPLDEPAESPAFCCVGCEAVFFALGHAGLDGFYAYRDTGNDGTGVPQGRLTHRTFAEFDSPEFVERETRELSGGIREADFYLDGVHCGGCAWLVEQMPQFVAGVLHARLDIGRARLRLRFSPEQCKLSDACRWMAKFGYIAHPLSSDALARTSEAERSLLLKVGVSWAIAANVMLLAVALYAGLDKENHDLAQLVRGFSFGLSGLSLAYGGRTFFRRAFEGLRVRPFGLHSLSMDVPISLGLIVGWGHSALSTLVGSGDVWFDSVSVLIAALLTARWLQMRGRRLAGDAAERLISLVPSSTRRVSEEGTIEDVHVSDIDPGDVVEVLGGQVVPVDGLIVSGQSMVSRAVLTGESTPQRVGAGDKITAGTANISAPLHISVEATGRATRIGRLVQWIEDRAAHRAPIVQLADRLGGVFVALVLGFAVVTAVAWSFVAPDNAVGAVVALLVVSCPCALSMATPLALTVAAGRAARLGIFIKHDDVVEKLAGLTTVVLDKTGTLTTGEMSVSETMGDPAALQLAAQLERKSTHPIAQAIAKLARPGALGEATGVEEVAGSGILGHVDGHQVRVGKLDWLRDDARDEELGFEAMAFAAAAQGATPVAVCVDGRVAAMITLADRLRPRAVELVRDLRAQGITVVLLSGDHPRVVNHIAEMLGIEPRHALGRMEPEQKEAEVRRRVQAGEVVAMVGDGVNDAAAIQAADVGVAMYGGSEASVVAADVFMTRCGLEPVLQAIAVATGANAVIRRTLVASGLYNLIAIVAAGFGLVGPLVAAIAMPVSSIAVVMSALTYSPKPSKPDARPG